MVQLSFQLYWAEILHRLKGCGAGSVKGEQKRMKYIVKVILKRRRGERQTESTRDQDELRISTVAMDTQSERE